MHRAAATPNGLAPEALAARAERRTPGRCLRATGSERAQRGGSWVRVRASTCPRPASRARGRVRNRARRESQTLHRARIKRRARRSARSESTRARRTRSGRVRRFGSNRLVHAREARGHLSAPRQIAGIERRATRRAACQQFLDTGRARRGILQGGHSRAAATIRCVARSPRTRAAPELSPAERARHARRDCSAALSDSLNIH